MSVVGSFSNVGYLLRSNSWTGGLPRLDGKTAVVTGATSGIGRVTATALADLGARTVIVGRDEERTAAVRHQIAEVTGNDDVVTRLADLSRQREVRRLAGDLLASETEIHVLVNNAAVLTPERRVTDEGVEMTLATNLLAPFLLTNLLIPRMVTSNPARIINVASGGMYTQSLALDDLQSTIDFRGSVAYARAKRGLVVLTSVWAEELDGTGVVANSMHPGWVDTPGLSKSLPAFRRVMGPLLRSKEQGADSIVWLAAADETEAVSGGFFHDRAQRTPYRLNKTIETEGDRIRLWDQLSDLSGWSRPAEWPYEVPAP